MSPRACMLALCALSTLALADDGAGAAAKAKVILRGEKLKGLPRAELTDVLAAPERYEVKTVQLRGKVRKACERKGCWMELAPDAAAPKSPGVRVTFKDYGFFVPLDSASATATIEGTVSVARLS